MHGHPLQLHTRQVKPPLIQKLAISTVCAQSPGVSHIDTFLGSVVIITYVPIARRFAFVIRQRYQQQHSCYFDSS